MSRFHSSLDSKFSKLTASEKKIVNEVWRHRADYIKWPTKAGLLWLGCVRVNYHKGMPDRIKEDAKSRGVAVNTLSNGPAIMSFLIAGGKRPMRSNGHGWNIDHIYDGKFPWLTKMTSLHAVKDGKHFTQAAGLVAIHPVAEALKDEYFYVAWRLRHEAFLRFGYDPDQAFCDKTDEYGFRK